MDKVSESDRQQSISGALAAVVLDGQGTIVRWSETASELLGWAADEVCGRPARELLVDGSEQPNALCGRPSGISATGTAVLRHRSGITVELACRVMPLADTSEVLVAACPAHEATDQDEGLSLLHALLAQDRIAIGLFDPDLRLVRASLTPSVMRDSPGQVEPGSRLRDLLIAEDAGEVEEALRAVLETGVPLVRQDWTLSTQVPGRRRALSLTALRLEDASGRPAGVVTFSTDITEQERARRHLGLLHDAAVQVGGSLDVVQTAQQLVDVIVPAIGDLATVQLAETVLVGDEPTRWLGGGDPHQRQVAGRSATGTWPAGLIRPGDVIPVLPDVTPSYIDGFRRDRAMIMGRDDLVAFLGGDPELVARLLPERGHSLLVAALLARGLLLGSLSVWRVDQPEPFGGQDVELVKEIASRAALAIDNARRYTREHLAAVTLQQRLLPPMSRDIPAAETSGTYRPAGDGAEISGDWFDVVPLPSLRVALVVGDVVGHGLQASATMGRLRTAIQTLSDLELDPEDLFTRIEDLVQRLNEEAPPALQDSVGATCLYAVYDPVSCQCSLISAGHPPPVVVRPDGTAYIVDVSPGPPLAVGGMPYETTMIDLEPGSVIALYTDGLIEEAESDIESGLKQLADHLPDLCRAHGSLDEVGRALLAETDKHPHRDDTALLLARTRAVASDATAAWEYPAEPAIVAEVRDATTRQLQAWDLEELSFTTELIISELVTNAIRYGGSPVRIRLIRDNVLVCEVSDPSNTQPRLRRALTTDEGGRGLFLVAQLGMRWGCRYGRRGKTIWAEQSLTAPAV